MKNKKIISILVIMLMSTTFLSIIANAEVKNYDDKNQISEKPTNRPQLSGSNIVRKNKPFSFTASLNDNSVESDDDLLYIFIIYETNWIQKIIKAINNQEYYPNMVCVRIGPEPKEEIEFHGVYDLDCLIQTDDTKFNFCKKGDDVTVDDLIIPNRDLFCKYELFCYTYDNNKDNYLNRVSYPGTDVNLRVKLI